MKISNQHLRLRSLFHAWHVIGLTFPLKLNFSIILQNNFDIVEQKYALENLVEFFSYGFVIMFSGQHPIIFVIGTQLSRLFYKLILL